MEKVEQILTDDAFRPVEKTKEQGKAEKAKNDAFLAQKRQ